MAYGVAILKFQIGSVSCDASKFFFKTDNFFKKLYYVSKERFDDCKILTVIL